MSLTGHTKLKYHEPLTLAKMKEAMDLLPVAAKPVEIFVVDNWPHEMFKFEGDKAILYCMSKISFWQFKSKHCENPKASYQPASLVDNPAQRINGFAVHYLTYEEAVKRTMSVVYNLKIDAVTPMLEEVFSKFVEMAANKSPNGGSNE